MNKSVLFCGVLVFAASFLAAQSSDDPAMAPFLKHFGARNYGTGSVSASELDQIIQAGIRAPSASNRQPWHFTVVQNQELAKRVLPQSSEGNILIIVSAAGDGRTNGPVILDCALAAESMYLAAQALGLGSRIYTGPIGNINSRFKTELGLPAEHNAVVLVRVGRLPAGVDAVSSASPRNNASGMVTYK